MIKIRFKKLNSGKFSVYLDIYYKDSSGIAKRFYDFLGIYVSADYSKIKRIKEVDKEKMRLANAIKSKREIELINSTYGFKQNKKYRSIDVLEVLENMNKKYNDHNLRAVLFKLKDFSKKSKLTYDNFTLEFLNEFKGYLFTVVKDTTVKIYLKRLRAFLNKAVEQKLLPESPMNKFKMPKIKEVEIEILTLDDLKKLQKTETRINPIIRDAFLFACFTGLRYSDIRNLKWTEIHENQIVIRPEKTTNTSGKILYIPLSEQAKKILQRLNKERVDEKVFPNLPINSHVNKKLKEWAKLAGIQKNLHFHISRHTFGTLGITYGIDLYAMQKLLGHSTIEMTRHYAKIVNEKLKAEISKMPTIE